MIIDHDLIIIGGGCAGLSLGMRVAKLGKSCPRTLILERRTHYTNDRSWCFWGDGSPMLRSLVSHSWDSMTVQTDSHSITVNCGQFPYRVIPADVFYSEAVETIRRNPRVQLVHGTNLAAAPVKSNGKWHIDTGTLSLSAKIIVDTRPDAPPRLGGAMLWQSFYGQEIECDQPVFDPARIDLMDFSRDIGSSKRIRFTYVLPTTTRRALVEVTVISPEPFHRHELATELSIALGRHTKGSSFKVVRSENGVLPMGLSRERGASDPTYIRAGLPGGAARPSTGYAFQRIQRWADLCAARINAGKAPAAHPSDPMVLRALDHLFLSVLRSRPERAPSLFLSIFEKTSTPRMIRFLSDRATALDYASVAWALPFLLFIQEIPRALSTATRPAQTQHSLSA